jgi:hypothetical protein
MRKLAQAAGLGRGASLVARARAAMRGGCGCVGGARGCGAGNGSRFRQLFCSGNCFFGVRPTLCRGCSPEARGAPAGTDGAGLNISTRVLFVKSFWSQSPCPAISEPAPFPPRSSSAASCSTCCRRGLLRCAIVVGLCSDGPFVLENKVPEGAVLLDEGRRKVSLH